MYNDVMTIWTRTLKFVEDYVYQYYNEDKDDSSLLHDDKEMVEFYQSLQKYLSIETKFKLKKFNVVCVLTHFICNATIWDNYVNGAVSFEYSTDPNFTGLKINNNSKCNTIINYVEYCTVVLSKGWNSTLTLMDISTKDKFNNTLINDNKKNKCTNIYRKYFEEMYNVKIQNDKNNTTRIAPFYPFNPQYIQSSIKL